LRQVEALQRNLGRTVASGYDGAVDYAVPVGRSQLSLGALVSYLAQRDYEFFQGEMPRHLAGTQGFPHWRGNAHLDATLGRWRVGYSLQYIGLQTQCLADLGDLAQTACFPIGSVLYHDLEAALNVRPGFKLSAGVLNLTDVDPPYIDVGGPNTDVGTYRLLGRSYYAALEYRL
jgi:outer membrane receptor protein involved in Fe transport